MLVTWVERYADEKLANRFDASYLGARAGVIAPNAANVPTAYSFNASNFTFLQRTKDQQYEIRLTAPQADRFRYPPALSLSKVAVLPARKAVLRQAQQGRGSWRDGKMMRFGLSGRSVGGHRLGSACRQAGRSAGRDAPPGRAALHRIRPGAVGDEQMFVLSGALKTTAATNDWTLVSEDAARAERARDFTLTALADSMLAEAFVPSRAAP